MYKVLLGFRPQIPSKGAALWNHAKGGESFWNLAKLSTFGILQIWVFLVFGWILVTEVWRRKWTRAYGFSHSAGRRAYGGAAVIACASKKAYMAVIVVKNGVRFLVWLEICYDE